MRIESFAERVSEGVVSILPVPPIVVAELGCPIASRFDHQVGIDTAKPPQKKTPTRLNPMPKVARARDGRTPYPTGK